MKNLNADERNALRKFIDALRDIVIRVQRALEGGTAKLTEAQRQEFESLQASLSQIQGVWETALKESAQSAQEVTSVQFSFKGYDENNIPRYTTDFDKNMSLEERKKVFSERVTTVLNLASVNKMVDDKAIRVLGDKFTISKNIFGAKGSKSEYRARINSLYDLAHILTKARFIGKEQETSFGTNIEPKNQAHRNVEFWYRFQTTINLDGELFDVTFNIRDKGENQFAYLIKFKAKKNPENSHTTAQGDLRRTNQGSSDTNISQDNEGVNGIIRGDGKNDTQSGQSGRYSLKETQAFEIAEDGTVTLVNPDKLSMEQWGKINTAFKRLGYDVRGAQDAKALYSRILPRRFNEDQSKALRQIFGIGESQGIASSDTANLEREKDAVKTFGTTTNFKEAGYLTINGKLLDFSMKREGGPPNTRSEDHRAIGRVFEDEQGTEAMIGFMNEGNIRLLPERGGIDLSVPPNVKQKNILRTYFNSFDGEVIVDFSAENGNSIGTIEYPKRTASAKILSDIDTFFKTGELPEFSDVYLFPRYSLKETQAEIEKVKNEESIEKAVKAQLKKLNFSRDWVDVDETRNKAREIKKLFDSRMSLADMTQRMKDIYDFMTKGQDKDGNALTWEALFPKVESLARDILDRSSVIDSELYDTYKALRDEVRTTQIRVSDDVKGDLPGGYAEFRKNNLGKMNLGNGGMGIDQFYDNLTSSYPEFFSGEIVNRADQLRRIAEVLEDLRPIETDYSPDMRQAEAYLAYDIIDKFWDVPQVNPLKDIQSFMQKKLEAERARKERLLSKTVEKYEAREARAKEYQNKSRLKNAIKKRAARLIKNVAGEKKYIPQELRSSIAEFINLIDFSNTAGERKVATLNALNKLYRRAEQLQKLAEAGGEYGFDPDLTENVSELSEILEKKRFSELSIGELQLLSDVTAAMESLVVNEDLTYAAQKRQEISTLGGMVMDENKEIRSLRATLKGLRDKAGNKLGRTISKAEGALDAVDTDYLKPVYLFEKMGGTLDSLYWAVRDGMDKSVWLQRQATHHFQDDIIKGVDTRPWRGMNAAKKTFNLQNGATVKLTPAQVMSLYRLAMRPQAQDHIYIGGIKPVIQGEKPSANKTVKVTREDVNHIVSSLTADQRKVADKIAAYMRVEAGWGNEISQKLHGYDKFTESNYFPIKSDKNYISEHQVPFAEPSIKNKGFTKQTQNKANNPLLVGDIFDVFIGHTVEMANYNALVLPLADFQRVWNYKDASGSVKEAISTRHGDSALRYIRNFIRDVNGGVESPLDIPFVGTVLRNTKAALIGANVSTMLKQPVSIIRAGAVIDAKYLAYGMAHPARWSEVLEHAPIAQWKDWGHYQLDVAPSVTERFFGETEAQRQEFESLQASLSQIQGVWETALKESAQRDTEQKFNLKRGETEKVSYQSLVSKKDMGITRLDGDVPLTSDGRVDKAAVRDEAMKNIRALGNKYNTSNQVFVYVKDVGANVHVNTKSIRHGLARNTEGTRHTARAEMKLGDILANSIKVNEMAPRMDGATSSYVLMGLGTDSGGNLYPVRAIVNRFSDNVWKVSDIQIYERLQSAKSKKIEPAAFASQGQEENPGAPLTDSTSISIRDFLEIVKETYADTLSQDVLDHFGMERPNTREGEGALYSLKDTKAEVERAKNEESVEKAIRAQLKKLNFSRDGVDVDETRNKAREIKKLFDSRMSLADMTRRMKDVYDFMTKGQDADKNALTWEALFPKAKDLARDILDRSSVIDSELYDTYKALRDGMDKNVRLQRQATHHFQDDIIKGVNTRPWRGMNVAKAMIFKDNKEVEAVFFTPK